MLRRRAGALEQNLEWLLPLVVASLTAVMPGLIGQSSDQNLPEPGRSARARLRRGTARIRGELSGRSPGPGRRRRAGHAAPGRSWRGLLAAGSCGRVREAGLRPAHHRRGPVVRATRGPLWAESSTMLFASWSVVRGPWAFGIIGLRRGGGFSPNLDRALALNHLHNLTHYADVSLLCKPPVNSAIEDCVGHSCRPAFQSIGCWGRSSTPPAGRPEVSFANRAE